MRVLLVSNLFPPYWIGGYEQIAGWVVDGLRQRGHDVRVLTGRGDAFDGNAGIEPQLDLDLPALCAAQAGPGIAFGSNWLAVLRRHVFHPGNYSATRALIRSFRPDLLSFWNPAFITYAPLLAARRASVPAIVHLSDASSNVFRGSSPPASPPFLRGFARAAVAALLRHAAPACIVTPSEFLRRRIHSEGVPDDRLRVLPWPAEPGTGRHQPPLRQAPIRRFLFVGRLAPEKGLEQLLSAFRQAVGTDATLSLTLVGDGARAFTLRLREEASGLPVTFAGRLDRGAVIAAYGAADVLVLPSVWDEPFAVVPLEAMAMALPVIATATGGTPEAVLHECTGLLVPAGDPAALAAAMLRLAADAPLALALGAAARTRARRDYDYDVFMRRLVRLYEDTCGCQAAA